MRKNSLLLYILIISCTLVNAQPAATFNWLEGTWIIQTGKGTIVEKWQKANDSTWNGQSFFVKDGKDTIPQEKIELSYRNGNWAYIPTALGQNNNQPVTFSIVFFKGTEFVAENPAHDFPQRIAYRRIKEKLCASIEGKRNGKYGKQNFDFIRVQ
ncbi:MAG: DUF6265 family protein [Bacteroidetes bacterium]|nr:DUF6265 family protein [Bacteroidota bacterium]